MRHLLIPCWIAVLLPLATITAQAEPPEPAKIERLVAIDNVCAWPNLTVLKDGTIVATIFNQPSHGSLAGDVECWSSTDGKAWKKVGTPAVHDPETNRMNVAAGLAKNGDLVVLASGWSNQQQPGAAKKDPFRDAILRAWVCRSADGGKTWQVRKEFPANPIAGMSEFIPFGDVIAAGDGSLRASCYAANLAERTHKTWMMRSDDDGLTWSVMALVSDASNETHLIPLGEKKWLAAARHREVELFRSTDDGRTWTGEDPVTGRNEINGHLLRLADGRVLLTYGNRVKDQFGVLAKWSSDEGKTWSEPVRLAHSLDRDCGYPSSVQLAGGQIVTAFYSKLTENHPRYHMGVAIWQVNP
jgi:Neuraminidase (sialidase)